MKEKLSTNQVDVFGLFPIAVYSTNIRKFTVEELKFVKKHKREVVSNRGNTYTKNTYLLEEREFKNLKIEMQKHIDEYVEKIIRPQTNIKCYITQSWLNYTKPGEYHQEHHHANSYLSGVLYFNADEKVDTISFHRDIYNQLEIPIKEYTLFNSHTWFLKIKTGQLLMFPSSLKHFVNIKTGNNTRISLSFNTFIKGKLGKKDRLTELKLNDN